MNKLKKVTFGALLAGLTFGFSAFTSIKQSTIRKYYKTDLTYPDAIDPRGYTYYAENRCEPGGELCSAQWDIGSNPIPNDSDPLPLIGVTFQTGTETPGHFE